MVSSSVKSEKSIELDDVLSEFSIFGRYHLSTLVLILYANMLNSFSSHNYVFAVEEVKYRCTEPSVNASCSCLSWEYEKPNSFVAEMGLGCEDWKRTLIGSAHSTGYMAGLLLVGPLSDRVGRKIALVVTGVVGGLIGIARSFSTNYWIYAALETLEAMLGDNCSPVFMLTVESIAARSRTTYTMMSFFGYTIGGALLPLLAWQFQYWRVLIRVLYTPALLNLLYYFLLDESPRWLLIKGKKARAIKNITKAAKMNNIAINESVLDNLYSEKEQSVSFLTLLKDTVKSKTLMLRFIVCLVWWTTSTFVNYGLAINSVSLQGNKYVNFALISLVDVPGQLIILFVLKKFKRKKPLILSFTFGAVLCMVQPFVPKNLTWLSVLVYMCGKLMGSSFFIITYIFTSELFPTGTRNSMHALCSSIGRVGSIIAPQTPLLMQYWTGLPSMVFGMAALIAAFITFLAPDIDHCALPDTTKQAEVMGEEMQKKRKNLQQNVKESNL